MLVIRALRQLLNHFGVCGHVPCRELDTVAPPSFCYVRVFERSCFKPQSRLSRLLNTKGANRTGRATLEEHEVTNQELMCFAHYGR